MTAGAIAVTKPTPLYNPALHANHMAPAIERVLGALGASVRVRTAVYRALRAIERTRPQPYVWRESVRWPIVRALLGNRVHRVRTRGGLLFDLRLASVIEKHVLLAASPELAYLWEPQSSKLLGRIAATAECVLVAGAYIGDLVLPIARRLPPGGTVHGFEPMAWPYEQFRHHCELNRIDNVRAVAYGLWDRSGVRMSLEGEPALARVVESTGADSALPGVQTISIDDYIAEQRLSGFNLMALDLEGGELRALHGAERQLARQVDAAPEILFEINSAQTDWSNGLAETDLIRYLHGFGYQVWAVRDFNASLSLDGFPIEVVSIETAILAGPPHGFNLFASKRPDRLQELDLRLCHHTSPKLILGRSDPHHQPSDWGDNYAKDHREVLV
jgi:FkbM family methyltransferase